MTAQIEVEDLHLHLGSSSGGTMLLMEFRCTLTKDSG